MPPLWGLSAVDNTYLQRYRPSGTKDIQVNRFLKSAKSVSSTIIRDSENLPQNRINLTHNAQRLRNSY